jgi:O-antigen ligase
MRPVVRTGAVAVLLAGPTVLAFFSGGYFDGPRAWAGLVAWALVVVAMTAVNRPLPRRLGGVLTVAGLASLAAWTLVSFTWAPIAGSAYHAGQRVVLYLGVLLAACALLRGRDALRAVEPALAAGGAILVGYALAERFLPGLLHYHHSTSAEGRLEQPITYWNALGEVAAIALVLCIRMTGDTSRRQLIRVVAAAAAAPLGMGLYLTFSRGALFAWVAGLVALIVLAPTRGQLRALVVAVVLAGLAAVLVAPMHDLAKLSGTLGSREREGAIALAGVVVLAAAGALIQWRTGDDDRRLRLPSAAPWIAVGMICGGLVLVIAIGAKEVSGSAELRPGAAARFASVQSSRYSYWKVALTAFGDEPIRGVGAGGYAVYWLRDRPINDFAQDAHSLPLQTLAELGVIGGLLLLAFLVGIGLAARDAYRLAPGVAAGPIAGVVVYVAHAPLDWDWQMPAVTLVALVLVGALIALAETGRQARSADRAERALELVHVA